ncbi:MAG: OmpA family protein [Granulosicoccus sp.]
MISDQPQISLPPTQQNDPAAYIPWVIIVACAICLVILVTQLTRQIPSQLENQAGQIMAVSESSGISVEVDGRDLDVTGNIAPQQSAAALLLQLEGIDGVRSVANRLTIVDPNVQREQRMALFTSRLAQADLASVQFQPGSVTFTSSSEPALQALLALLQAHPQQRIRIEGHTDNTGPDAVNFRMSEDRAAAVSNYLATRGIAADRLIVKGYGATQPVDTNNTETGRSKNRRIEVSHVH